MCDESFQLHYIYIDEYRGVINKQNINIINEYVFKFENNLLTHTLNRDFIENMYGFVKSINIIVGKNGSGKTSLFRFMLEIFASSNYHIDFKYILVTKEKGKFYCYASEKYKEIGIDTSFFEKGVQTFDKTSHKRFNHLLNTKNYYTGVFSNALYLNAYSKFSNDIAKMGYEDHTTFSYTTTSLLKNNNSYIKFNQEQNRMNMNFLTLESKTLFDNVISFPLAEYLAIGIESSVIDFQILDKNKIPIKYYNQKAFYENIYELHCNTLNFENYIEELEYYDENPLFIRFSILQHLFFDFMAYAEQNLSEKDIKIFENIIYKLSFPIEKTHCIHYYIYIYNQINNDIKKELSHKSELIHKLNNLISVGNIIKDHSYLYDRSFHLENTPYGGINIHINDMKSLYAAYANYNSCDDFLEIYWDRISSGENALLNTYARLFDFYQKVKDKKASSIFIFFDEIELYMHPEWQRKAIHLLGKYCNEKFKLACQNLQLFFATNSPFSLSDIVWYNVIYLENKDTTAVSSTKLNQVSKKNTFGQNIHTLLTDSFFMDYTIGEFSRSYINSLIKVLSPVKRKNGSLKYDDDIKALKKKFRRENIFINEWEDITKHIDIISDRLIKEKLHDMLDMCRYGKNTDKAYLERLKSQRARIDGEIHSLKDGGDKEE